MRFAVATSLADIGPLPSRQHGGVADTTHTFTSLHPKKHCNSIKFRSIIKAVLAMIRYRRCRVIKVDLEVLLK